MRGLVPSSPARYGAEARFDAKRKVQDCEDALRPGWATWLGRGPPRRGRYQGACAVVRLMRKGYGEVSARLAAVPFQQRRTSTPGALAPSLEPTDLRAWRRARVVRTKGPALSRPGCRPATPDGLVTRATRHSAAGVFVAEGDVKRLGRALTGAALPTDRLQSLSGHCLPLDDLCMGWLVVYCFPGLHIGNEESHRDDERDHHAYARCFTLLERRGIRLASVSSAPCELQAEAMREHRLMHTMMLDPDLLVADALGLPTLSEDGRRAYSRLTLVVKGGVIEHVFYPARGGRSAEQAVTWLQLHARLDSLSVG